MLETAKGLTIPEISSLIELSRLAQLAFSGYQNESEKLESQDYFSKTDARNRRAKCTYDTQSPSGHAGA